MCVLLAKMSSGKSAVNKPIELIMKDIVERDALNRLREQEWKASLSTKGANKEKPKRPEGLCIQMLVPDMTNAAFVQRLADAQGKFLYTQMDELELLNNLKTSARGNQVSQIIRLPSTRDSTDRSAWVRHRSRLWCPSDGTGMQAPPSNGADNSSARH